MKYLLDSNIVIALFMGEANLLDTLQAHRPEDFGLPSIVAYELFYGAYRSQRRAENLRRVKALAFEIVAFGRKDAEAAGRLRADLAAAGTPIGPYDVLIAGQAVARDLALVSRNTNEFSRVPGLHLLHW